MAEKRLQARKIRTLLFKQGVVAVVHPTYHHRRIQTAAYRSQMERKESMDAYYNVVTPRIYLH